MWSVIWFYLSVTVQCPVYGGYGKSKCERGCSRHIGTQDYYIWSRWNVTLNTCNSAQLVLVCTLILSRFIS